MDEEHTLVMAPPEAKKFESELLYYQKDSKDIKTASVSVNQPLVSMDGKFIRPVMMKNWEDGQTSAW